MVKCNLTIITALLTFFNVLLLLTVLFKGFAKVECTNPVHFVHIERIGEERSAAIEKYRFVVAIVINTEKAMFFQCAASIVSNLWVLSSGHCIELVEQTSISINYIYILAGSKEWKKGKRHKVIKMISNNNFKSSSLTNDTSLLKVKERFDMITEVPIVLAGHKYKYIVNSSATVIGWGYNDTDSKNVQNTLFAVDVLIFSKAYCTKLYGKAALTKDMFCAGSYQGGKDACQFDSGGPIVQNNILIGIVSWGGDCGKKTQTGVYARISYFINWFKQVEEAEGTKIDFKIQNNRKKNSTRGVKGGKGRK